MLKGKYLLFDKKAYESRENFKFPPTGMTIYCAETDKIYRPQKLTDVTTSVSAYFEPEIYVKREKLIFFCYNGELDINTYNEELLRGRKNKDYFQLTQEEFERGNAALDRYIADPLASLVWPFKDAPKLADLWHKHFSATATDQSNRDLLILGERFKDTGPEKLPGRPKAVNFIGGKLVELNDAQIKAGVQARL